MDPTTGSMHYFAHKRVKPAWTKSGFRFYSRAAHVCEDGGEIALCGGSRLVKRLEAKHRLSTAV